MNMRLGLRYIPKRRNVLGQLIRAACQVRFDNFIMALQQARASLSLECKPRAGCTDFRQNDVSLARIKMMACCAAQNLIDAALIKRTFTVEMAHAREDAHKEQKKCKSKSPAFHMLRVANSRPE